LRPTWSLGVEEQFYIFWPVFLLVLLRCRLRPQRLLSVVLSGILVSTVLRALLLASGASAFRIVLGSDTRADALLFGCALSLVVRTYQICPGRWLNLAAPAGLALWVNVVIFTPVILDGQENHLGYSSLPVFSLSAIAGVLLIGGLVLTRGTGMHRVLSSPISIWIGKRSYGLYLWNVTAYACTPMFGPSGHWHQAVLVLATLVPVVLSYELVERPVLRLKSRLRPSPALTASVLHSPPVG